jgi:hypothetical protein
MLPASFGFMRCGSGLLTAMLSLIIAPLAAGRWPLLLRPLCR